MKLTNTSLYINPRSPNLNSAKLRKGGKRPGVSAFVHVNGSGYDSLKAPKVSYNSKRVFGSVGKPKENIRPPQLMDYRKLKNPLSQDRGLAALL